MKSNTMKTAAVMTYQYGSGNPSYTPATSGGNIFVVSPSPCHNGTGNRSKPNAYEFSKIFFSSPIGVKKRLNEPIYRDQVWSGSLSPLFGERPLPKSVYALSTTTADNKALAKLYDRIRDSEISLATTIGEGRETLDLVRAVQFRAQSFLDSPTLSGNKRKVKNWIKRRGLRAFRNKIRTVGQLELFWNLSLRPLLMDVEALRNHLVLKSTDTLHLKVSARASDSRAVVSTWDDTSGIIPHNWTIRTENVIDSVWVEYGVTYRITDLHTFENWRAGLTVRPSLLWELTSLSFVVDYFYNVGQYLQILEGSILNNGIAVESGFKTVSTRRDATISENYQYTGYDYKDVHNWTSSFSETHKKRVLLTSWPLPGNVITTKLPRASTPLLNIAGLLSQLIAERR